MADRIIKGDSGNDVVIQNNAGSRKIEVTNSGDVEVTGDFKATTVKATNIKANDGTSSLEIADSTGQITSSVKIDLNGNELILDVDADSSITADTDDQIDFRSGGADSVKIGNEHLTINDGNLVIGTSGHGIDFSGAQSALSGTTNQILSGYEKGTWTPTASDVDGGVCTFSNSFYLKIGEQVLVGTKLVVGSTSDSSGVKISLPFTADTNFNFGGYMVQNTNSSTIIYSVGGGGSFVFLKRTSDADWTYSNLTGQTVAFSLIYHT